MERINQSDMWSEEQLREYCKRTGMPLPAGVADSPPKQSKYRNKRTEYNGRIYDSKREAQRAAELQLLVKSGDVAAVLEQVAFTLAGGIKYRADFVILGWDGTFTVEDSKGILTKEYRLKKRLMAERGIEIHEV